MSVYHEKIFSGLTETIFERYKARIDILIAGRAGDVLEKIPSVYNRLVEDDSEAISQAMNTCRRVIDAVADVIYPPTDQPLELDGQTIDLGPLRHQNRINAYIRERTNSKSRRDKLRQTLTNLYNRVSTGVHNEVTPEEAQSLFLQTYLFLGEVLTLGEPPDRTTVHPDSASPEMTSGSV